MHASRVPGDAPRRVEFVDKLPNGDRPLPGGETQAQNGFLFIGELAKLTGTDPKTIRFYERAGLLSPPRHGRFRTYLASDVRRLKNVLALRKLGMPIAQIKVILQLIHPEDDVLTSAKAAGLLRGHLDALRNKQAEISQQIEQTSTVLHRLVA
jgi:DNA-binding transcriptional MerR regulator